MGKVREVTRVADIRTLKQREVMAGTVIRMASELLALTRDDELTEPIQLGETMSWVDSPFVVARQVVALWNGSFLVSFDYYLFGLIRLPRSYTQLWSSLNEGVVINHRIGVENVRAVRSMIEAVVPES